MTPDAISWVLWLSSIFFLSFDFLAWFFIYTSATLWIPRVYDVVHYMLSLLVLSFCVLSHVILSCWVLSRCILSRFVAPHCILPCCVFLASCFSWFMYPEGAGFILRSDPLKVSSVHSLPLPVSDVVTYYTSRYWGVVCTLPHIAPVFNWSLMMSRKLLNTVPLQNSLFCCPCSAVNNYILSYSIFSDGYHTWEQFADSQSIPFRGLY